MLPSQPHHEVGFFNAYFTNEKTELKRLITHQVTQLVTELGFTLSLCPLTTGSPHCRALCLLGSLFRSDRSVYSEPRKLPVVLQVLCAQLLRRGEEGEGKNAGSWQGSRGKTVRAAVSCVFTCCLLPSASSWEWVRPTDTTLCLWSLHPDSQWPVTPSFSF